MTHAMVKDLSIEEFRQLIREVMLQTFSEIAGDPDNGLELNAEFALELQQALAAKNADETIPAHEAAERLGLSW